MTNIEWSSGGEYPWKRNMTDGIWQSGNFNKKSTTSELISNNIEISENGGYLCIEWSVSSAVEYGKLEIIIMNVETGESEYALECSGDNLGNTYNTLSYAKYNKELQRGIYKVSIKYTKSSTTWYHGLDRGYIKSGTILQYNEEGNNSARIRDKSGGFVIYEGTEMVGDIWAGSLNRNQFVWIPVQDIERVCNIDSETGKISAKLWNFNASKAFLITDKTYKEPYITDLDRVKLFSSSNYLVGYTQDMFYKELEIEYKNTIKSIEKYGGFYIGRYETGNLSSDVPVIMRMNNDISNQPWYKIYEKMKNISSNRNVQTCMIWGSLWDETLKWIEETGEKTQYEIGYNSTTWGNYYNSTFTYKNASGSDSIKEQNRNMLIPTGSTEYTKANNIYDLAGNVFDSTLESLYSNTGMQPRRWARGGCYSQRGYAMIYNDNSGFSGKRLRNLG